MLKALTAASRKGARAHWTTRAANWESWEPVIAHSLASGNPPLLRALDLDPGLRVVDFGCGSGDPALEIAQWIGPRGKVLGLDISTPMLEVARRRAKLLQVRNATFRRADISHVKLEASKFDRVVSRYGLMFAADIPTTLGIMLRCLKRGGRAAIAVWGPIADNPGGGMRDQLLRKLVNDKSDPEATPHPMRLARPGLLARLMREAGFARAKAEPLRVVWTFPSPEDYARMQLGILSDDVLGSLTARKRAKLRDDLYRGARKFQAGGVVRFPGLAWLATGVRPR